MTDIKKLIEVYREKENELSNDEKFQFLSYIIERTSQSDEKLVVEFIDKDYIQALKNLDSYQISQDETAKTICSCLEYSSETLLKSLLEKIDQTISLDCKLSLMRSTYSNNSAMKEYFKTLLSQKIQTQSIENVDDLENTIFKELAMDVDAYNELLTHNKETGLWIQEFRDHCIVSVLDRAVEISPFLDNSSFYQSTVNSTTLQNHIANLAFSSKSFETLPANDVYQIYRTQPAEIKAEIDGIMQKRGFEKGFIYDIPFRPQQTSCSCWYASIKMIKPSLPEDEQRFYSGLYVFQRHKKFTKAGLKSLPFLDTFESLKEQLVTYGPLYASTNIRGGHAVVITGVKYGEIVTLHEPGYHAERDDNEFGRHFSMPFKEFQKVARSYKKETGLWYNPNIEKDLSIKLIKK